MCMTIISTGIPSLPNMLGLHLSMLKTFQGTRFVSWDFLLQALLILPFALHLPACLLFVFIAITLPSGGLKLNWWVIPPAISESQKYLTSSSIVSWYRLEKNEYRKLKFLERSRRKTVMYCKLLRFCNSICFFFKCSVFFFQMSMQSATCVSQ